MKNRYVYSEYTSITGRHESGLSLVEVLVGLVIGLIGIIVMMQVYALSEERKRTTTAGSDAQNSAFIALDTLQRAITQSGVGFAHTRLLDCNIQLPNGNPVPLAPVIINPPNTVIPAGDANSIRLLVSYGSSNDQPDGYNLSAPSTGPSYTLTSSGPVNVNDWLVHAPTGCPLLLRRVTNHGAGTLNVDVAANPSTTDSASALFNLGATPRFLAYAVRNGTLVVCDYMTSNCGDATAASLANQNIWQPVISNVAAFQAQYGRDTSATKDGIPDTFDQATPDPAAPVFLTVGCDRARISAIRLAVVTRSVQYEKNVVVPAAVAASARLPWLGDPDLNNDGAGDGGAGSAPLTISGITDWDHFRYRVFETVIPLRNIIWMGAC